MLQIRDLVKVYPGGVTALRGLHLDVPQGMFGLLGPNGSGKTTLMRILAGLLEPTSGEVRFGDVDVVAHPEAMWPRLGYLPQSFGFYPHLTGAAMLIHMLRLKGVEAPGGLAALCEELLERVNLAEVAQRKVSSYSGGMRQRLGIAQALAGDPELVVVDEPTAGLDPEERTRFHRLLAEVAEERTVLLSTHIVEDVAVLCPRFAVIRHGRLLATTTPARARAALEGTVFEGEVESRREPPLPDGGRVTRSYLVGGRNRLRLHLPDGTPPPGFEPAPPSLEDAYLLLVQGGGAAARISGASELPGAAEPAP